MNAKQVKNEALSIIDAALAILNKFPDLNSSEQSLSLNLSTNPFAFLLELFKTTAGYNYLIRILSSFLWIGIPPLEVAIKGIILTNLRNLLTCSINPFITEDLIRDGVVFNVGQLDITDTLRHSPLASSNYTPIYEKDGFTPKRDSQGNILYNKSPHRREFYYFGCENMTIPDEVKYSRDMNALLWYMRNRANQREVWGQKEENRDRLEQVADAAHEKYKKADGIITLDYHERSNSLLYSSGGPQSIQTPMNDCLQVFIGNVQQLPTSTEETPGDRKPDKSLQTRQKRIESAAAEIANIRAKASTMRSNMLTEMVGLKKEKKKDEYKVLEHILDVLDKYFYIEREKPNRKIKVTFETKPAKADEILKELERAIKEYKSFYEKLEKCRVSIDKSQTGVTDEDVENKLKKQLKHPVYSDKPKNFDINTNNLITLTQQLLSYNTYCYKTREIEFPQPWQNYYYNRTIMEFDFDYIMSVKLFDYRVLTVTLIDQIIGGLSVNLDLTAKEYLIREEIKEMVNRVLQTDDLVVDECFFTFDNDSYNKMLQKAEMKHAGLTPIDGSSTPTKFNVDEILETLSSQNIDSEQAGSVETAIEGALSNLSGVRNELGKFEEGTSLTFNADFAWSNILDQLLDNLAYSIVSSLLTPKVQLLYMYNLKLLGQNPTLNLEAMFAQYSQLITSLIRAVRDQIITFLVKELQKLLADIARAVALKISMEQARYYMELIRKIIACFSLNGAQGDWTMDNVQHADIAEITSDTEPKTTC